MELIMLFAVAGAAIAWHELGHWFAARACGVGVQEFSVGIGPKVISFRVGVTRVNLRLLLLGGYVDPSNWDDVEPLDESLAPAEQRMVKNPKTWLANQPLYQRVAMLIAGPGFNFIMAYVILLFVGMPATWDGSVWQVLSAVWDVQAREAVLGFSQGADIYIHPLNHFTGMTDGWALGPDYFLRHFALINFGLGVLNLLPIPPLDGGQIVKEGIYEVLHGDLKGEELRQARIRRRNIYAWFALAGLLFFFSLMFYR